MIYERHVRAIDGIWQSPYRCWKSFIKILGVRVSSVFFFKRKGAIRYDICLTWIDCELPISSMMAKAAISDSSTPSTCSLIKKRSFSDAIYFTAISYDFWSS
jgi:hypothetical protein